MTEPRNITGDGAPPPKTGTFWTSVNLNTRVRVKLTAAGRASFRAQCKASTGREPAVCSRADRDGWSVWHLYDLMYTFGRYLRLGTCGRDLPFEDNVIQIDMTEEDE